jgi:hypothetical protein
MGLWSGCNGGRAHISGQTSNIGALTSKNMIDLMLLATGWVHWVGVWRHSCNDIRMTCRLLMDGHLQYGIHSDWFRQKMKNTAKRHLHCHQPVHRITLAFRRLPRIGSSTGTQERRLKDKPIVGKHPLGHHFRQPGIKLEN